MRAPPAAGILLLALAASAVAQETRPPRPRLPVGEDSCDAQAYFHLGEAQLALHPEKAEGAFYWASRLDPLWPDPLYARRVALLTDDASLLLRYVEGDEKVVRSPRVQRIDSLQYRAFMLNPFLFRRLEERLVLRYRDARYDPSGVRFSDEAIEDWTDIPTAGPEMKAWVAYVRGAFPEAAGYYRQALRKKQSRESSRLQVQRADVFFLLGEYDSTRAALAEALKLLRARDEKKLVYVYESKALYEHAIGLTYELQHRFPEAREAYARALEENLAYSAAHVRTAVVALETGDTAAALAAMELAVQVGGDDPPVLYRSAELLLSARRPAEAEARLRRLIAVEPYFALPYSLLARALEAQGRPADAAAQYRAFLERTWRTDPNRAPAEAALRRLLAPATTP